MNRNEYEKKIEELGINLKRLRIVIGEKTIVPYSTGCYCEGDKWFLYYVGERQNLSVTDEGTEEEIFKYLYMITLGKHEEYYR